MLFASTGYHVCLYDVVQSQLDAAMAEINQKLKDLEAAGNLRGSMSATEQFKLISAGNNLEECVKDARHVQVCPLQ